MLLQHLNSFSVNWLNQWIDKSSNITGIIIKKRNIENCKYQRKKRIFFQFELITERISSLLSSYKLFLFTYFYRIISISVYTIILDWTMTNCCWEIVKQNRDFYGNREKNIIEIKRKSYNIDGMRWNGMGRNGMEMLDKRIIFLY